MEDFAFNPGKNLGTPTTPQRSGKVKSWSYSGLKVFEQCKYQTFLKSVERIPQESHEAAERGNRIHDLCEQFVDGTLDELPSELLKMEKDFLPLREQYAEGKVVLEEEWAYDVEWNTTDWRHKDAWLRLKLDVLILESETSAIVIDHKTGKRFGNEMKHAEQLMLYAICTFLRYPKLEFLAVINWYIDHNEKLERFYTREEAMVFFERWTARAVAMTSEQEFPPSPSKFNCKWCPYKKSGDCKWAE